MKNIDEQVQIYEYTLSEYLNLYLVVLKYVRLVMDALYKQFVGTEEYRFELDHIMMSMTMLELNHH